MTANIQAQLLMLSNQVSNLQSQLLPLQMLNMAQTQRQTVKTRKINPNPRLNVARLLASLTGGNTNQQIPFMAQNPVGLKSANLMSFMNKTKLAKGQNQSSNKNRRGQAKANAGSNLAGLLSAMVGGNTIEPTRCIRITGLADEYQDADKLTNIFGSFGNVIKVKFTNKKPDGALIELDDPRAAIKAVVIMNNQKIGGSAIKVSFTTLERAGFIKEDDSKSKLVFKAKENWRFSAKNKDSKFRRICLSRLRSLSNKVIVSNLPEGKIGQLKNYIIESGFTVKSIESMKGRKRPHEEGTLGTGYTMAIVELADREESIAAVATLHNTWPIKFGAKKVNRFDRSLPLNFAFAGVIKEKSSG